MPGINTPKDDSLCRRCSDHPPAITVRTEPLCKPCFLKYATTKVIKRLETFRVRNAPQNTTQTLLIPLSFGPCSTALLHILSAHRKNQASRTRRTGYNLHVVHVLHPDGITEADAETQLNRVKERYPEHTYALLPLSTIFDTPTLLSPSLPTPPPSLANPEKLTHLLTTLPSPTARTDILQTLHLKLLVSHAGAQACTALLPAHTTTHLATLTLALTAKGRGATLPYPIADGPSPFGTPFYFPLRDLLAKEVSAYVAFLSEPRISDLVIPDSEEGEGRKLPASSKNNTIDALMRGYFEGVEREFPGIVANVVRTVGKLEGVDLEAVSSRCEVCEMPLVEAPERSRVCYGCIRNLPREAEA